MDINRVAQLLWEAQFNRTPIEPVSQLLPGLSLEQAYAVSRTNYQRRLAQSGVAAVGRKIGLTSLAVQTQLGVSQPDFGYLTSDMLVPNRGSLPAGALIQGRVEGEVAFRLKSDLFEPKCTWEQVVQATDYVQGCIEVIDSRVRDWKITITDTVSDNASSAYVVLGDVQKKLSEIDLRMSGMVLRKNGVVESTGIGAACLGHPIEAVVWLAQTMAKLGDPLKKGDLVLAGAFGPVVPFLPGDHCEVQINGLGKIQCNYLKK